MILVVGATGVLGQRAVRLLLAEGHRVRALTRMPERAKDLERQGAEIVVGDLIDAASVGRACRGATRVLAAAHSFLGKGTYRSDAVDDAGHRALIDAARSEGVTRFVYTSGLGAAPDHPVDFFRTKYAIEQYLKASGLDYVILRPSAFMEWHAHIFNGKSILDKGRTTLLGSGTKLRNFVAATDVAHFAVLALTAPKVVHRVLEIGGPGNFSNNQVAELYAQMVGIQPRVSHLPRSAARILALVAQPFQPGLSRVMRLASLPDDAYSETFDPTNLLRDYPTRLTSLQEFVRNEVMRARKSENEASSR